MSIYRLSRSYVQARACTFADSFCSFFLSARAKSEPESSRKASSVSCVGGGVAESVENKRVEGEDGSWEKLAWPTPLDKF